MRDATGLPSTTNGAFLIGLDVGATKIAAGIVTSGGEIIAHRTVPTKPDRGGVPVLDDALALTTELLNAARDKGVVPVGVGVGIAELVDLEGKVVSAQTIRWRGLPVRERFSAILPAVIESDSRAAACCEAMFGAGREYKSFLFVTIGTGIGCSLVVDGVPLAGARGSTGTLATAPMTFACEQCGHVSHPVLEEIASGPALVSRYNLQSGRVVTRGEDVLGAAAQGDKDAIQVIQSAGEAVGAAIGLLVNVLDPEAIVVGGGLGVAGGMYWEKLVASTRQHIWSETHRQLPIVKAKYGGNAGFVGAAVTAYRRLGTSNP